MDEFSDGENTAYFTFDVDKRRIWAKRNGTEEKYVLNEDDVIADYDSDNSLKATYNTWGLDGNLTKKIDSSIYFYVIDALGSIRNIIDSNETVQNAYDYKAFGDVFGSPTENISNRYQYTARALESIPELYYNRARMYNQLVGRFSSKDPIFYSNLYHYVDNNPLNFVDPYGWEFVDKWNAWCQCGLWWSTMLGIEGGYYGAVGISKGQIKCYYGKKIGIVLYKKDGDVCYCTDLRKKAICSSTVFYVGGGLVKGVAGGRAVLMFKNAMNAGDLEGWQLTTLSIGIYEGGGGSIDIPVLGGGCSFNLGAGIGKMISVIGKKRSRHNS